jgi:hypothetical protein
MITVRKSFSKGNSKCLEYRFAFMVVIPACKLDMCGDTGTGTQAVKEMLEDVSIYTADGLSCKFPFKEHVTSPAAIEYNHSPGFIHRHDCMGEPPYPSSLTG